MASWRSAGLRPCAGAHRAIRGSGPSIPVCGILRVGAASTESELASAAVFGICSALSSSRSSFWVSSHSKSRSSLMNSGFRFVRRTEPSPAQRRHMLQITPPLLCALFVAGLVLDSDQSVGAAPPFGCEVEVAAKWCGPRSTQRDRLRGWGGRIRTSASRDMSRRPTAWLAISDSNFDVRRDT
jgi:hypothetical protein